MDIYVAENFFTGAYSAKSAHTFRTQLITLIPNIYIYISYGLSQILIFTRSCSDHYNDEGTMLLSLQRRRSVHVAALKFSTFLFLLIQHYGQEQSYSEYCYDQNAIWY